MDHSADEISAEIWRKNRDIKIIHAHWFTTQSHNNQVLKLTLASPEQAAQVCNLGFSAFGIKSGPDQITLQRFHKLKQCFKYFQYDHYSSACNIEIPKCSRCAGEHNYRECTSPTPKCALCNGAHIAISHLCPHKQDAINQAQETVTTARQQAAITIPAPPPVNAWGNPNQGLQAQSVDQEGTMACPLSTCPRTRWPTCLLTTQQPPARPKHNPTTPTQVLSTPRPHPTLKRHQTPRITPAPPPRQTSKHPGPPFLQ
nr:uncharacterized protein LOC123752686 [Procambarus clarkii]